jgi:hypothetical protein
MARRPGFDHIDVLCRQWAETRRQLLGLADPALSRECIGPLRSTLGQRRDLHAGATSSGRVEQHFPEVYTGEARRVNEAFHALRPALKVAMDLHYCARAPADQKAAFLCISRQAYWQRVRDVRAFVDGYLARPDSNMDLPASKRA